MNEVKSPKKPLVYYYTIVLILLLVFNFVAMPWISEHQIKEVDYNTFIGMVDKGQVSAVEIQEQSNRILFKGSDSKIYKTAMVPDDDLVSRLLKAGVSTTGEEIEQTSALVSILGWLLPIIIFVALGQYMSRKMMDKMGGGNSMMFNMGKSNARVYVKSAEARRVRNVHNGRLSAGKACGGIIVNCAVQNRTFGYDFICFIVKMRNISVSCK